MHCDKDKNCKGYVKQTEYYNCEIATTSNCPSGCTKRSAGQMGILIPDVISSKTEGYDGCYIKIMGRV